MLLCTPSDTAADTIALRLGKKMKPGQLLRLNSSKRTFAEVPEELILFCHIAEDRDGASSFGMPPWDQLMAARVVVTATYDVPILLRSRCSNVDLQRLQQVLYRGLRAHGADKEAMLHWTHLLVDEAGQGTEAEMTAAIACVLPLATSMAQPVLCLCGDAAQLGPRITSHDARSQGLDWSLFERLLHRKVYADALRLVRQDQRRSTEARNGSSTGSGAAARQLVCGLRRNYRAAHPALLSVPSALFYNDALLPCAPPKKDLEAWIGLPNPKIPILFECVDSPEVWVDEGVSWHSE